MAITKDSTLDQAVDYLRSVHGEDMKNNRKSEVLARIAELEAGDPRKLTTSAEPAPESKRQKEIWASGVVKIFISEEDKPGGQDAVFVGVNGISYRIQRGVEVDVPKAVLQVLLDAKNSLYRQNSDGSLTERQVLSYPVSRVA